MTGFTSRGKFVEHAARMTGLAIYYGMLPIQGKACAKMIEGVNVDIIPTITKVGKRFRVSSV